jgi:aspartyl/asparaginyl beta-hydroxylase (cupin superfamily)
MAERTSGARAMSAKVMERIARREQAHKVREAKRLAQIVFFVGIGAKRAENRQKKLYLR